MARKRFRGGMSESQRRKKTWVSVKSALAGTVVAGDLGFLTALAITVPATAARFGAFSSVAFGLVDTGEDQLGDEVSTLPEESTILRIRGSLDFPASPPIESTIDGTVAHQHAFGIGVTDVRSLVNGAFPGPISDPDWDGWMFMR